MEKVITIKRSSFLKIRTSYAISTVTLLSVFFSIFTAHAQTASSSETVNVSATVISNTVSPVPPPPPVFISNNGVPLTNDVGNETVIFKGWAYPSSQVAVLKNGLIINELPANQNGTFEVPVHNISTGVYTFGLRAKDKSGLLSNVISYTIYVGSGVETTVDNIFIPPTISTDKIEVKKGDTVTFFGSTFPNSLISLTVFANNGIVKNTTANSAGDWTYTYTTQGLELGDYTGKAKAKLLTVSSDYSSPIVFTVGTANKLRPRLSPVKNHCDLNSDSRVNLLDFSIMAFWYKRLGFPVKVDLNSDGRVNLIDLSILAYCWTG